MASRMERRLAAAALTAGLLTLGAGQATAQEDWRAEWAATIAKAKGQTLALAVQQGDGFDSVVDDFQKKFPDIKVQRTGSEPSQIAPRMVTEQKNGVFAWDSWWSSAANMTAVVLPAGGFEKITDYLILPEVKDPASWQDPNFIYTSEKGPYIHIHTNYLEYNALYNTDMMPGGVMSSVATLLDPKLKGRMSIRVPSRPHGGTSMLAAMAKEQGVDFVRRLFTEMQPRFVDNDRQVTTEVMNGATAVAIGTTAADLYARCLAEGGCQNIKPLPIRYMHSRAVAVMKNAPHKEATKVWVNWLLSREGQETYVRDWSKSGDTGAFSMRKDVAPDPKQLGSIPDFAHLDKYVAVSFESGVRETNEISKLYSEIRK